MRPPATARCPRTSCPTRLWLGRPVRREEEEHWLQESRPIRAGLKGRSPLLPTRTPGSGTGDTWALSLQAPLLRTHLNTPVGHKIHAFGLQRQLQTGCLAPGLRDTGEKLLGSLFILAVAVCEHTWPGRYQEDKAELWGQFDARQSAHRPTLCNRISTLHHTVAPSVLSPPPGTALAPPQPQPR